MQDSKLISILRSLTKREFKEFGQFVRSPFFNRLNNVVMLFDVLKPYYPNFSNKNLTEKKIYQKIFIDEGFDYWKFKNLISDIMALTEEFLAVSSFKKDEFEKKKYLLGELGRRNLYKLFDINYKEMAYHLDDKKIKSEGYFRRIYETELLYGSYLFDRKDFSSENYLTEITANFINYSLLRILKLYSYTINENIAFKSGSSNLVLISEIIDHVKQFSYKDTPAIRIYFLILMITMHDDEHYYFELKEIRTKNKKLLDIEELHDINIGLVNFCTRMVLTGERVFLREYFELIKELINDDSVTRPGSISHFRFMNAVITGIKLNELNWVENFINEKQIFLEPDFKNETVSLTNGMMYFAQGEYENALAEIQKINFDDCHHKMHLRNLTLQIYYELDYFEAALSIIDSYRHFLSREKTLTELYRDYNLNFVKYFSELLKIKMELKSMEKDELLYLINKSPEFANKAWIIKKLKELQK